MKGKRVKAKSRARPAMRARQTVAIGWKESAQFQVPVPHNEPRRLAALRRFQILDTPPEENFDALALLAARVCNVPIALISLVDADRQWFKSRVGVDLTESPRAVAFCAHAIMQQDLFVVPDAAADKRFANNPLVKGEPKIRFYAGTPLVTRQNHALGTLCVIDHEPRQLTPEQIEALKTLGHQVMAQLELRKQLNDTRQRYLEVRLEEKNLRKRIQRFDEAQQAGAKLLASLEAELRVTSGKLAAAARKISPAASDRQQMANWKSIQRAAEHLLGLAENIQSRATSPATTLQ